MTLRRNPDVFAVRGRSSRSGCGLDAGYTAIEVLLAMTVMAIGAAAVMSMQKASMQGNLDARKMDVANAIARTWVERLQRDSTQWTLPGPESPSAASNLTNAKLISSYVDKGWFVPDNLYMGVVPETTSYGFDILGRDLPDGADMTNSAIFCVNTRFVTLIANQMLRADVRVLWLRGLGTNATNPSPFCSAQNGDMKLANPDQNYATPEYHGIYVTTAIRQNIVP